MSVFDLPLPAVAELVASVRGPQPGIDETADAFARVAWTVLIEPGDQVAGQLIGALGSRRALELVIAGDAAAAAEAWTQDGTEPRSAMQRRTRSLRLGSSMSICSVAAWPGPVIAPRQSSVSRRAAHWPGLLSASSRKGW